MKNPHLVHETLLYCTDTGKEHRSSSHHTMCVFLCVHVFACAGLHV